MSGCHLNEKIREKASLDAPQVWEAVHTHPAPRQMSMTGLLGLEFLSARRHDASALERPARCLEIAKTGKRPKRRHQWVRADQSAWPLLARDPDLAMIKSKWFKQSD